MKKWGLLVGVILVFFCTACGREQKEVYQQVTDEGNKSEEKQGQGDWRKEEGTEQENAEKGKQTDKKKLSGTLVIHTLNSYTLNILAEAFMELYPDVTIEFVGANQGSQDFAASMQTLAVEMMSGNAGDLVDVASLEFDKIVQNGLLCDLYSLIKEDTSFQKEDYFENILKGMERDKGKLYAMPFSFSVPVVYLNKQITEGIETDMSQYNTIQYQQILELYDQAKEKGILPDGFVVNSNGKKSGYWTVEEGVFVDTKNKIAKFDTPEFLSYLQSTNEMDYDTLMRENTISYTYSDNRLPENTNCFQVIEYQDMNHFLRYGMESEQWNKAIPMVNSEGNLSFLVSSGSELGISESSQNKEVAWEFIKYCIEEKEPSDYGNGEQSVWYKDLFAGIPINRKNCRNMAEYMSSGLKFDEELYNRFLYLAESASVHTTLKPDLYAAWGTLFGDFYDDSLISAQECAKQLQERTEIYFQE